MSCQVKCHPFSDMADVGKLFKVGIAFLVRDGREQVFRFAFSYIKTCYFLGLGKERDECGVVGLGPVTDGYTCSCRNLK